MSRMAYCRDLRGGVKLGEGAFGEVFMVKFKGKSIALKVANSFLNNVRFTTN